MVTGAEREVAAEDRKARGILPGLLEG